MNALGGATSSARNRRPHFAFVVVAVVLVTVAGRVLSLGMHPTVEPPRTIVQDRVPALPFSLEDAAGRPIAFHVDRYELEMSPRSMWQAHTPDHMALTLSEALGGQPPALELLRRMLPDARLGVIDLDHEGFQRRTGAPAFDTQAALRVQAWIAKESLPGIRVDDGGPSGLTVSWEPTVLLSREARSANGAGPLAWTRKIARGLADALWPDPRREPAEVERIMSEAWRALMPSGYAVPVRDVPPDRIQAVEDLLRKEGVAPVQMRMARGIERSTPAGDFRVLGTWGWQDPEQSEPRPLSGLELLGSKLFSNPDLLAALGMDPERTDCGRGRPSVYAYRRDNPPRSAARPYYLGRRPADAEPWLATTLDLALTRFVRRQLEALMAKHRPAAAMAIVLDVAEGSVLAVDAVEQYESQYFAPLYYQFTPGSAFKVATMASALEAKVVVPEETIDVGQGSFHIQGSARVIHEAEGHATGRITAAECLAHSSNAGLVQIGLRIPDAYFAERIRLLGYGRRPEAGLGAESGGYVPATPWKRAYSHASICIGHELNTTLWQHAAGLLAVVSGGIWRPLRMVSSVRSAEGTSISLCGAEERVVFSPATCATVRAMMELGAREGTGDSIYRADLRMGTKTGTAQKVPTEVCAHVLGIRRAEAAKEGRDLTSEEYADLRGLRSGDHRSCYTSSMCVWAGLPGDPREVMVLVVVDEPRGRERFGSKVAGPAAAAIVAEALGLTRSGDEPVADNVPGFAPTALELEDLARPAALDQPWRGGGL